jgi:phage terminase large subunit-like protein
MIPTHNSTFTAALILLVMATDGEQAAEVYSVAASQKQAGNVYDPVAGMIRQQAAFDAKRGGPFKILGHGGGGVKKLVSDIATMSRYECLASDADTADGTNPHFNAIDELHRHKTGELMDVLIRSSRKRAQPLNFITTTADYARESACNSTLAYAKGVLANPGDPSLPGYDVHYLPAIWEASKDDDWQDPETWRKANPGLGTIKSLEGMQAGCLEAKDDPTKLNSFLRLDLNIVTDLDVALITADAWDACAGEHPWSELPVRLRGETCYGAFDLSITTDLTALAMYFPVSGAVVPWFWIPEKTAQRLERSDPRRFLFAQWAREGALTIVPGDVIDQGLVRQKVLECRDVYDLRGCGYDPYNARETASMLELDGVRVTEYRQGQQTMSPITKQFLASVASTMIVHGGHPVLRWNALNVVPRVDANGNIMPSKGKSTGQIDGIVAAIMAMGEAWLAGPPAQSLNELYAEELEEEDPLAY